MARVRCEQGHFYDDKRFHTCPHCSVDVELSVIRKAVDDRLEDTAGNYNPEISSNYIEQPVQPIQQAAQQPISKVKYVAPPANNNVSSASPKTVGFYKINEVEPVVGWIICMNKDMRGRDFRLIEGRNIISNDIDAEICLPEMKDGSGGMAIMYDSINDSYFIQSGESTVLVNGEDINGAAPLDGQCVIDIDEYNLVFIPFCEMGRNWNE